MRLMICDIYNLFGEADKKKTAKTQSSKIPGEEVEIIHEHPNHYVQHNA